MLEQVVYSRCFQGLTTRNKAEVHGAQCKPQEQDRRRPSICMAHFSACALVLRALLLFCTREEGMYLLTMSTEAKQPLCRFLNVIYIFRYSIVIFFPHSPLPFQYVLCLPLHYVPLHLKVSSTVVIVLSY